MKKLNTYLKYMIPKNKVSFVYFLALVVSLVWLKEMNYLFYSMLESPDFDKNYVYLEHFFTEVPLVKTWLDVLLSAIIKLL